MVYLWFSIIISKFYYIMSILNGNNLKVNEEYDNLNLVKYADAFKGTVLRGTMDYDTGTFTTPHECIINNDLTINGTSNATSVFQASALLVPTGSIMAYISTSAPEGWLICDGTPVSRTIYSNLFISIGITFGPGDGITTFNLPNTQGRMLVAYNSADGNFDSIGEIGGSKDATLTTNELPAHTHTGTTSTDGAHTHTVSNTVQKTGNNTPDGLDSSANEIDIINTTTTTTSTAGSHNHTFTTNSTGSGNAFSIMNPYFTVTYIIKY